MLFVKLDVMSALLTSVLPRLYLTLWLRLADKSAKKTCQIGMDGWQIGSLDSTILARMAGKLTSELSTLKRY